MLYKSCSKCGRIHEQSYVCRASSGRKAPKTLEQKLRSSRAWTLKAIEIKERASYLCELCRDKGRYNYDNLEVHHIEKVKDEPTKLLDNYNLICLCSEHHKLADDDKIEIGKLLAIAKEREQER